jgi:hypothetical protein
MAASHHFSTARLEHIDPRRLRTLPKSQPIIWSSSRSGQHPPSRSGRVLNAALLCYWPEHPRPPWSNGSPQFIPAFGNFSQLCQKHSLQFPTNQRVVPRSQPLPTHTICRYDAQAHDEPWPHCVSMAARLVRVVRAATKLVFSRAPLTAVQGALFYQYVI